jgi:protein-tyrosine phosphatase
VFDFLFKEKKKLTEPVQPLTVDLHSHLLPGIDDGAKTEEETLTLVRGLQSLGYRKCITTPHIYKGVHNNSKEIILEGLKKVTSLLMQHRITFEIEAAAEYFFDEQFFQLIEQRELMSFGKNFVLFELPFTSPPLMLDDVIFKLNLAGYQPVLAHPERYPFFHDKKMKQYEKLKNAGVLFQLNLMSLTAYYNQGAKMAAHQLIESGMIEFAGSDLHREKHLGVIAQSMKGKDFELLVSSGKLLNNQL